MRDALETLYGIALNCRTCKRTMLHGLFANGYDDGPTLCHSCKAQRNAELEAELRPHLHNNNEETECIGR